MDYIAFINRDERDEMATSPLLRQPLRSESQAWHDVMRKRGAAANQEAAAKRREAKRLATLDHLPRIHRLGMTETQELAELATDAEILHARLWDIEDALYGPDADPEQIEHVDNAMRLADELMSALRAAAE